MAEKGARPRRGGACPGVGAGGGASHLACLHARPAPRGTRAARPLEPPRPRVLRPGALRGRRGAPRALLDVGRLGDDARDDLVLRHPHPAHPDGPGIRAGRYHEQRGAQRPRADPRHPSRNRDPERGVRAGAPLGGARSPEARALLGPSGGCPGGGKPFLRVVDHQHPVASRAGRRRGEGLRRGAGAGVDRRRRGRSGGRTTST